MTEPVLPDYFQPTSSWIKEMDMFGPVWSIRGEEITTGCEIVLVFMQWDARPMQLSCIREARSGALLLRGRYISHEELVGSILTAMFS
jgi:hypothetical protein